MSAVLQLAAIPLKLTCLSPDIVAAILENELPDHITLFELAVDPSPLWKTQRLNVLIKDVSN